MTKPILDEIERGKWGDMGAPIVEILLHWAASARAYRGTHKGVLGPSRKKYHMIVLSDGTRVMLLSYRDKGEHVFRRNTGKFGLSMTACRELPDGSLEEPTPEQLESYAATAAELLDFFRLPLTALQQHKHYGQIDGYGSPDIGPYFDWVKNKAAWYLDQMRTGKRKNSLTGVLR